MAFLSLDGGGTISGFVDVSFRGSGVGGGGGGDNDFDGVAGGGGGSGSCGIRHTQPSFFFVWFSPALDDPSG